MGVSSVIFYEGPICSSGWGSRRAVTPALPKQMMAGAYRYKILSVPARGTVIRIHTAEEISIQPANFVSLAAIAAPINPMLEKRAAWTPERVYSLEVAVTRTNSAAANPKNPPVTPIIKDRFI
jgi:hypothetical protein